MKLAQHFIPNVLRYSTKKVENRVVNIIPVIVGLKTSIK